MAQHMNFVPDFQDATREQAKASIVIEGLSGYGKSGLALLLAIALSDGEVPYAVDTEKRSLNLFDGIQKSTGDGTFKFKKFDLLQAHGYSPSNYIGCREYAKKAGAKAFIQDSITHAWQRKGGVLDLVAAAKEKNPKLNNYTVWGVDSVKDEKELIFEMFRDEDIHVISTVRVKEKQELVEGKMKSLGEQQIFMPDTKYEPDLVLHMVAPGNVEGKPPRARVEKSRYAVLIEGEVYEFTPDLLKQIRDYLAEGADPKEMREAQRQEIIAQIKAKLDSDPSAKGIWPTLKEQAKVKDVPLTELKLKVARQLLGTLLQD